MNRLAALAKLLNDIVPCVLPASVRALARVPTMPALREDKDTQPLLPGARRSLLAQAHISAPRPVSMGDGQ